MWRLGENGLEPEKTVIATCRISAAAHVAGMTESDKFAPTAIICGDLRDPADPTWSCTRAPGHDLSESLLESSHVCGNLAWPPRRHTSIDLANAQNDQLDTIVDSLFAAAAVVNP